SVCPSCCAISSAAENARVVKLCTALGVLDTPLAESSAVARQKSVTPIGRSMLGMNPVSLIPSLTVTEATIVENAEEFATSNLSVMARAGPVRVTFDTRSAGRGPVIAPLSGPIGFGVLRTTAGPIVNFMTGLNGPVVPPPVARARQK